MLICIAVIIVFLVDLSGGIDSISRFLWKIIVRKPYNGWIIPKPFSCSLCLTFWFGLLYLLITGQFNLLTVMLVCLLAYFTPVINNILIYIKDRLLKLF